MDQAIAVIDIGKTRSKASLWSRGGALIAQLDRSNAHVAADGVAQLDHLGIGAWLKQALADFATRAEIAAIVPVGHGAAAVITLDDAPFMALDYEAPTPPAIEAAYDAERDPFAATLSPRLAGGLNLGAQFFWLERLYPQIWPGLSQALLWPQYWAFFLSGERASEVTTLGCHSDLWRPFEHRFSDLALRHGWAERLGPLRGAGDVLGQVRPALAEELGLPRGCLVHCGVHDSNAALHAARGMPELAGGPFSVVSTGTWFVCLAAGGAGPVAYDPAEDMLANVDVAGHPTPTARFMGGRLYEDWLGEAMGARSDPALLAQAGSLGDRTGAPGPLRATTAALELARRADRALGLVRAEGPILVEGRFADDPAFTAALAGLRPAQSVYRNAAAADGVARGALRLAIPDLAFPSRLTRVTPAL